MTNRIIELPNTLIYVGRTNFYVGGSWGSWADHDVFALSANGSVNECFTLKTNRTRRQTEENCRTAAQNMGECMLELGLGNKNYGIINGLIPLWHPDEFSGGDDLHFGRKLRPYAVDIFQERLEEMLG